MPNFQESAYAVSLYKQSGCIPRFCMYCQTWKTADAFIYKSANGYKVNSHTCCSECRFNGRYNFRSKQIKAQKIKEAGKVREPINKSVRFQVLCRDGFTCQYCGRRAPDVELHIDHKLPVSQGGDSSPENLVTSCADCNLGKRALVV